MSEVKFEDYERAVKRFGYTGRLNDDLLTEIGQDINLKPKDLLDADALAHYYYQSEHCFDHGNYDTAEVLHLGFLLCDIDPTKFHDSFWGLLNPEVTETVPRDDVKKFLNSLCTWAVDVPLRYQMQLEDRNGEVEEYLNTLKSRKSLAIEDAVRNLGPNPTRNEVLATLVSYFTLKFNVLIFRELNGQLLTSSDGEFTPKRLEYEDYFINLICKFNSKTDS